MPKLPTLMPRPVLFITSNGTLIPTWEHLARHYDLCIIGPQAGLAMDMGLEGAYPLAKYGNADLNEVAINASYEIAGKLHQSALSASLSSEVERWSESGAEQLSASQVRQWFPAMVGEHVRQQAMIINMLKAAMSEWQGAGCVVHEDVTPDMRAIVLYCKARGVPTIHVPHANTYYTNDEWDIHTESVSGYIAAGGNYSREFYIKWGFPADRIHITGTPQLDSWYTDNPPSQKESRQVLGIGQDDFAIIYATSWAQLTAIRGGYEDEHTRNLKVMTQVARDMKAALVVKMHPGEGQGQETVYHKFLQDEKVNGCVTRHYNEYVLRAGDVLVAHGPSNICVNAAIVGLPSVTIPTEGHEFPFGPVRYNGDMKVSIEEAMKVGGWDEFAKTMNDAHPKGNAGERIAEFVKGVCG